jgi:hypothetical protein
VRQHAEQSQLHEQTGEPELKIVLWEHSPENSAAAADQVKDCDVLAMEYTGFRNDEERQAFDREATICMSSTAGATELLHAKNYIKERHRATYELLNGLQGTDKQVITVDMNADHPDAKLEKSLAREERRFRSLRHSHPESSKLEAPTEKLAAARAQIINKREDLVVGQVEGLLADERMQGKKVGLLIGAAHTRVMHKLAAGRNIEHVFVTGDYRRNQKQHFNSMDAITRHKNIIPDRPVPRSLVRRAILEQLYTTHNLDDIVADHNTGDLVDLTERLTDQEVDELLLATDAIKRNSRRWVPVVSSWKMQDKVAAVLRDKHEEVGRKLFETIEDGGVHGRGGHDQAA